MSPFHSRVLVAGLASVSLSVGVARAQAPAPPVASIPEEPPPAGTELVGDAAPAGAFVGVVWSTLGGSEVESVDPAIGFEVGGFVRLFPAVSVWGSAAYANHAVSAQLARLLDQPLRPDGRSGRVEGEVRMVRLRAGVRLDAMREPDWRYTPYFVVAASLSRADVTIDSIDGNSDPPPVPGPDGEPVDVTSYHDTQIGALGRLGVEFLLTESVRIDVHGSFEAAKLPPSANYSVVAGAGLGLRF